MTVASPLKQVHKIESEKARLLLAAFRNTVPWQPPLGQIDISHERADHLEMLICEALVEAFQRGYNEGVDQAPHMKGAHYFIPPKDPTP